LFVRGLLVKSVIVVIWATVVRTWSLRSCSSLRNVGGFPNITAGRRHRVLLRSNSCILSLVSIYCFHGWSIWRSLRLWYTHEFLIAKTLLLSEKIAANRKGFSSCDGWESFLEGISFVIVPICGMLFYQMTEEALRIYHKSTEKALNLTRALNHLLAFL
jgi:hypothetical protein